MAPIRGSLPTDCCAHAASFPSDQSSQAACVQRLEATFDGTCPQHRPHANRSGNAFELFYRQLLELEQIAEKLSRAFGDYHHVRSGESLQTRRQVWRLTDDAALLRASCVDQIADNDYAGGNANARLQRSARIQSSHRCSQFQPSSYCTLGIILMRLRIAEIDQYTVAQILRYEAAKSANGLGGAFMIIRNNLAQILRVQASGQGR